MSHTGQAVGDRLGAGALPVPEELASLRLHKAMLAAVTNTPWNTQGLKYEESATLTPGGSPADTPTDKQLTPQQDSGSCTNYSINMPTKCTVGGGGEEGRSLPADGI